MKGSFILLVIAALVASLAAFALWPSDADVERVQQNLERKLARGDDELAKINANLFAITKHKWANNLKRKMEGLRNQATSVRADAKAIVAGYDRHDPSSKADALQKLTTLSDQAAAIETDGRDLRVRTDYIRDFLARIDPLRAEARERRAQLTAAGEKLEDQELLRRIKTAIDASSRAEDLVQQALERLPSNLKDGEIVAQTSENEMKQTNREMQRLLEVKP